MRNTILASIEKIETLSLMLLMIGASILVTFLVLAGLLFMFGGEQPAALLMTLTGQSFVLVAITSVTYFVSSRFLDRKTALSTK